MRTFKSSADRKRVVKQLPPRKCRATANRTGEQCRRDATIGADVCHMHGAAAPQVRRKAAERVTLAEALAADDRRHPWAVMEDALSMADVMMRQARAQLTAGESVTVAQIEKAVAALERAHRLAKANVDAGIAERRQRFAEGQAREMERFIQGVLGALELTAQQKVRVPAVIRREIEVLLAVDGEVVDGDR